MSTEEGWMCRAHNVYLTFMPSVNVALNGPVRERIKQKADQHSKEHGCTVEPWAPGVLKASKEP